MRCLPLFEDLHGSPPIVKRLRFAQANSPIRFTNSATSPSGTRSGPPFESRLEAGSLLSQLHALFPEMEEQVVEKLLEDSNHDLDYAIKSLNLLRLSASQQGVPSQDVSALYPSVSSLSGQPDELNMQQQRNEAASSSSQSEGGKWVELLVSQMMSSSDMDDARIRAAHTLEAFEKTAISRSAVITEELQKENAVLKEQNRVLLHDNHILKRAVAIQHERQQEHEGRTQELQQVKQLLAQYQERVRTLEVNNYSLTLHLRQAQDGSSMPGRFHPDVF